MCLDTVSEILTLGEITMDYEKKIDNLKQHISEHPNDYQAVIGLLKANSDAIEHQLYERKIMRLKRVAEVRRQYNEEHTFE